MKSVYNLFLRLVLVSVFIIFFITCSNDENIKTTLSDKQYLPLSIGLFQIYTITETEYINGLNGITKVYELKTEIMDSILLSDNIYSYVIYRSTRTTPQQAWNYLDTWTATFTDREARVQEGNVSFVKLDLPIANGNSWNGNLYNSLGEEKYMVSILTEPEAVNNLVFDDVLEVVQRNEQDNIVGNDIRKEMYARGVGLISREVETITYCTNTPECLGEQIIQEGFVVQQKIKEYGKN
jgi:hypothetical protein